MNIESLKKELEEAYAKLSEREEILRLTRLEVSKHLKVEQALIDAGYFTREKITEAEKMLGAI